MDQVLKRAMEKRDEAIREAERWESWIRTYAELAEPVDAHETPISRSASPPVNPADDLDIPSAIRAADIPAVGNLLPRTVNAN